MRLSEDGRTLLRVRDEDIINGTFIVPAGVITIGDRAFSGCTRLTQVNLPVGLTTIGDDAFFSCARLTQVNFPDGLTT
ncbi:MAG: leucine-rich repeat domain-containing protein, partial [Gammaproteobacteria bacterium]|nr:leucine-rich repeat domain-containing protein [Gammaproteobacteria bacterium]